jgi:hypothetical protein
VVAQRALGARVRRALLVGLRLPPRSLDPGELGLEPGELGIALGLVALGLGRVVADSGSRPNGRSSGTRTALVPIRPGSSSSRWVAGLAPTEPGPEDPGDDFGIDDPNAINVLQRSRGPETPVTSDDGDDTGTIEVLQRSRGPETPVGRTASLARHLGATSTEPGPEDPGEETPWETRRRVRTNQLSKFSDFGGSSWLPGVALSIGTGHITRRPHRSRRRGRRWTMNASVAASNTAVTPCAASWGSRGS